MVLYEYSPKNSTFQDEDEMIPEEQKPAYKLQFGSGLSFLNNSGIGGGVSSSSNILLARPKGRQNSGYPGMIQTTPIDFM